MHSIMYFVSSKLNFKVPESFKFLNLSCRAFRLKLYFKFAELRDFLVTHHLSPPNSKDDAATLCKQN